MLRELIKAKIVQERKYGWISQAREYLRRRSRHNYEPSALLQLLQLSDILPDQSQATLKIAYDLVHEYLDEEEQKEKEQKAKRPWWYSLIPEQETKGAK